MNMIETFLVVGLGNPGREYRETRHNVGFMMLDRLAVKLNARFTRLQSRALIGSAIYNAPKGDAGERKIILAKPQTFMNLSGQSVQGLVHFYKLPLTNLLVAHDDLDLPPGTIRIRPDGGSAGQKGMESILERLGTDDFPRLRLGIGRPPGQMQAPDYVLQEFSNSDLAIIPETLDRAVEAVLTFVTAGLDAAMNKYNGSLEKL
jgi:PTH1 family peptidyl-tRNA hydrolase